jgi:hypothetical protein
MTPLASGVCLLGGRAGRTLPAVSGGVAFVCMLIAKGHLDNEVLTQGRGIIGVGYRAGFVLTCVLLCVGAAICLLQRQRAKTRQTTAMGAGP